MSKTRNKIHLVNLLFLLLSMILVETISAVEDTKKELHQLLTKKNNILPPDKVFQFSSSLRGKYIEFEWEIDENCYLYLDKFSFFSKLDKNYEIALFPKGEILVDEHFGKVEVFFDKVKTSLYLRDPPPKEIVVSYQGCNQTGYCYTPITKEVFIDEKLTVNIK